MTPPLAHSQSSRTLSGILRDRSFQDGAFAGCIMLSRIPANLGPAGAALSLVLMGAYCALRLEQCRDAFHRCHLQLAYPLFALLSFCWAVYPVMTARAGFQMILTVFVGLVLSQASRPRSVLVGLFCAYATYTVASVFAGKTRADGILAIPALIGLGGEAKNFFSDTAGTAALLSLAATIIGWERRSFVMVGSGLAAAVACFMATQKAHSAGGVASLALATGLLAVLLFLRTKPKAVKAAFTIAIALTAIVCAIFFDQLIQAVQEMSGKDAGLTGRGYLWYRAEAIIAQRPWLGTGFFGFWTPMNPDAVGLWHYFDIKQEGTGFSFHNSYIQTIVETGYIGVCILAGSWVVGVFALLRRLIYTTSLPTCFWLSYLALQLSKTPVELIRPTAFSAPTIMLSMALGFGCFPVWEKVRRPRRTLPVHASWSSEVSDIPLVSDMQIADTRLTAPAKAT